MFTIHFYCPHCNQEYHINHNNYLNNIFNICCQKCYYPYHLNLTSNNIDKIIYINQNSKLDYSLIDLSKRLVIIYKTLIENNVNIEKLMNLIVNNKSDYNTLEYYEFVKGYIDLNTFIEIFNYKTVLYFYRLYLMYSYLNNNLNKMTIIKILNRQLWFNDFHFYEKFVEKMNPSMFQQINFNYDEDHFVENYFNYLQKGSFITFYEYFLFNTLKEEYLNFFA